MEDRRRDAILALKDDTLRLTTAAGEETMAGTPAEPLALTALRDALDHWRRGAAAASASTTACARCA